MSTPVGKRGEPEYNEPLETPKKSRGKRSGKAKTEAIVPVQFQPNEEITSTPIGKKHKVKREPRQELESSSAEKMRKGEEGLAVRVPRPPREKNIFGLLGPDLTKQILRNLSPKDLQAARGVDRFMNQQAIDIVQGDEFSRLVKFTDFLCSQLPEIQKILKTPPEIIDGLKASNLDNFIQALYDARTRLIEILATRTPSELDRLEAAYKETGEPFPTTFKNIFALAKVRRSDDFSLLHEHEEYYELVRNEVLRIKKEKGDLASIMSLLESIPARRDFGKMHWLAKMDTPTFHLIEQAINSLHDDPQKYYFLIQMHVYEALSQTFRDDPDKAADSFGKALDLLEKQGKMLDLRHSYNCILKLLDNNLRSESSAFEKFYAALTRAASAHPDTNERVYLRVLINTSRLVAHFRNITAGNTDLTNMKNAMERITDVIESVPNPAEKAEEVQLFKECVYSFENELQDRYKGTWNLFVLWCFSAAEAANESDAKYALLATLHTMPDDEKGWYGWCPNWAIGDKREGSQNMCNKIYDKEFNALIAANLDLRPHGGRSRINDLFFRILNVAWGNWRRL